MNTKKRLSQTTVMPACLALALAVGACGGMPDDGLGMQGKGDGDSVSAGTSFSCVAHEVPPRPLDQIPLQVQMQDEAQTQRLLRGWSVTADDCRTQCHSYRTNLLDNFVRYCQTTAVAEGCEVRCSNEEQVGVRAAIIRCGSNPGACGTRCELTERPGSLVELAYPLTMFMRYTENGQRCVVKP